MRKPVFFIALNGAILLLVLFFLMQSLVIIQMMGTADRLEGTVEVKRRSGNWQTLVLKEAVHASDVVRTGPASSAELRWRDGTRIRLGPETTLTVKKFAQNAVSHSQVSLFDLTIGKVWVRVVQALKPASRFEIETPTTVAAIRGTVFSVNVDGDGNSAVSVFEGKVHVRDSRGKELDVDAGRVAEVTKVGEEEHATDLAGAQEWAQQSRIVGPALLLEEPTKETAAVTTATIRLKGYVEPGATLTINGNPVRVGRFGEFSHRLQLQPGRNSVAVVATDRHGRQTTHNREIMRANGQ